MVFAGVRATVPDMARVRLGGHGPAVWGPQRQPSAPASLPV